MAKTKLTRNLPPSGRTPIQTQLSCQSAREASLFLAALANATKVSPGQTRSVSGEPKETVRASGCFPNSNAGPIEVSKNDIRDEKDTSENEERNQERLRLEMQLVRLRTMPHRQRANYKNQVSRYPNLRPGFRLARRLAKRPGSDPPRPKVQEDLRRPVPGISVRLTSA